LGEPVSREGAKGLWGEREEVNSERAVSEGWLRESGSRLRQSKLRAPPLLVFRWHVKTSGTTCPPTRKRMPQEWLRGLAQ
jgi:hypothetical protein